MKKPIHFLMLTACMLGLGFSSCSSNDSPESKGELSIPPYEENSALYVLNQNTNGISSIELTESGNYVILGASLPTLSPFHAPHNAKRQMIATRNNEGTYLGKFIKISDTEFILEGFGTIVIEGAGDNAVTIWVTPAQGESYALTGEREDNYGDTAKTIDLCRTWDISNVRFQMVINGKSYFDETKPASQYSTLIDDINRFIGQFDDDGEGLFEPVNYNLSQLIFTKAGSYLVTTTTNELGYSLWKWKNESAGVITYTHDVYDKNFSDPDYANDVTVSFSGNKMMVEETISSYQEEGESGSLKAWFDCVSPN